MNPARVPGYHAEALTHLTATYGTRLHHEPDSVEYRVLKVKTAYAADGHLPKGNFGSSAVAFEVGSKVSLRDDMDKASRKSQSGKVKSTVYEQTARMMVYGSPEASLIVRDGIAKRIYVCSGGSPDQGSFDQVMGAPVATPVSAAPVEKKPAYVGKPAVLIFD